MGRSSVRLVLIALLSGSLSSVLALPSWAQETDTQLSETRLAQASLVQITHVRLEETDAGLQIVLETTDGELSTPTTTVSGDALIVEITNALLIGEAFEQFGPTADIAVVQVLALSDNRVQVAITGADAAPTVDVSTDTSGLTLSVIPGIAQTGKPNEPLRIVVTGDENEGYNPSSARTATRTDTPLRNVPRSVQVIPRQIIEDQQANNINQALENVPGIVPASSPRTPFVTPVIRGFGGFSAANDLFRRNGLRDPFVSSSAGETANIERIEVLRGPASVLYGQGSLGGITNIVTKQPLSEPFYEISGSAGSYDTYRGAIDLSGPINDSGTLLYRLNLAAGTEGSSVDFYDRDRYLAAAVVDWRLSDATQLTFDAEYSGFRQNTNAFGLPAVGTVRNNLNGEIEQDRYIGDADAEERETDLFRVGLSLDHDFSDNWRIRSAFEAGYRLSEEFAVFAAGLQDDDRTLDRNYFDSTGGFDITAYTLDTYMAGEFKTGNLQHQLVTGVELLQEETTSTDNIFGSTTSLDLFNPEYGNLTFTPIAEFDDYERKRGLGIYVQDQISLTDDLILVLGGRYDIANVRNEDFISSTVEFQQNEAFSPQIGIVYSPIEPLSIYASYSRSFAQETGRTFDNSIFQPLRGTQYEIGLKADINDQLSTTLALYDLTLSNVVTEDPENPGFDIQTGEQNSQGIELSMAGEILPGWNITAGYAYNDARITEDNSFDEGNRLNNAPENAFSLWSTYRIQQGDLSGLGFGLGLFYVGEREGDLANSFELPGYLRTDAAVFYEKDRFRASINVRNLFDIDYFETAQNDLRVSIGEPLTVSASLSWQF